ncbi:hypothetical protein LINPERPRIM_LOCUS20752 [Linum perenne]
MCIFLCSSQEAKLDTVSQIDKFISAELPDPSTDHVGYVVATKFMVHGPCGTNISTSPCMVHAKCKNIFSQSHTHRKP